MSPRQRTEKSDDAMVAHPAVFAAVIAQFASGLQSTRFVGYQSKKVSISIAEDDGDTHSPFLR